MYPITILPWKTDHCTLLSLIENVIENSSASGSNSVKSSCTVILDKPVFVAILHYITCSVQNVEISPNIMWTKNLWPSTIFSTFCKYSAFLIIKFKSQSPLKDYVAMIAYVDLKYSF